MRSILRSSLVLLGLCAAVPPAAAQWTRVTEVPVTEVFSVWAGGDTILAATDTCVVVSTDAGASWRASARPRADVVAIGPVLLRGGRMYAGTFAWGVFVSDDLGASWTGFNQGLVGGFEDSQLHIADLAVRGDSLYAATLGAGVYVRGLAGATTWSHFGDAFEPNQASNVAALGAGGSRVVAGGGDNGEVFFRDPGDADWTVSELDNVGLEPGISPQSVMATDTGWLVGTSVGVFRSAAGESPWTYTGPGLGALSNTAFARRGRHLFAAFIRPREAHIVHSDDDGATWQELEQLPHVFVFRLAMAGDELYAARADGLWRRSTAMVSVPVAGATAGLRFAIAGAQPVGDVVRFRVDLPEAGDASLDVFDVGGRRAAARVEQTWAAGGHAFTWSARGLAPGVYEARLSAGGRSAVVRLVRVRAR
jgi:hypothetical protein